MTKKAPTRSRVLACIREYPGIHLRAIERELGLSSALVHYHVKQLEAAGTIVSANVGGYLRFYPKEAMGRKGARDPDFELLAYLREEVPLHIVLILLEDGPSTQTELAQDLELARSTVNYHVEKLEARGLVTRDAPVSGERVVRVRDPAHVRRLLGEHVPTTDLQEKFRSLWEDFYGGA